MRLKGKCSPVDNSLLVISMCIVILMYLGFIGFTVWLFVTKSPQHPVRLLGAIAVLLATLPPVLYAMHSVVV
jgi:hypothetical protein